MTIEASSASSVARPNESKGVKSKQGNDGDSGGGFMAVLASVEAPEHTPASTTGENAAGSQKPAKGADAKPQAKAKGASSGHDTAKPGSTPAKDAASVPDDAAPASADVTLTATPMGDGPALVDPAVAALALLQSGEAPAEPMDASALLAQSAAWAASGTAAAGSVAAVKGPGELQNGLPGTMAIATPGTNSGPAGLRPPTVAVPAPEGAAQPAALQTEQLPEALQKALKTAVEAKGKAAPQAGATAEPALPADGKLAALLNQKQADGNTTPLATVLASAAANVVATPRREESSRERSVFRSGSQDSVVSPQALSTPAPSLSVSGAPEVVPATDAFVAEKVSYWISNNVQNAEMKLDGVGDRPVEVSIRMQGNEAHVAFRTDELQTRAALENASVHLKDLLQREGLVLSGVSVGMAGAGESGAQERKSRQGERQTTVAALQPLTGDVRSAANRSVRGGLDLFV